MITLNLTEEQAAALREALGRYLSDLSMEIADTDSQDYREMLKRRRAMLRDVMEAASRAAA